MGGSEHFVKAKWAPNRERKRERGGGERCIALP